MTKAYIIQDVYCELQDVRHEAFSKLRDMGKLIQALKQSGKSKVPLTNSLYTGPLVS